MSRKRRWLNCANNNLKAAVGKVAVGKAAVVSLLLWELTTTSKRS